MKVKTCATCRYFVLHEATHGEQLNLGDCRRYPPKHIVMEYKVVEFDATDKAPMIATAAGVPARPLSMWLLQPQYSSSYDGTSEGLTCGEWRGKEDGSYDN